MQTDQFTLLKSDVLEIVGRHVGAMNAIKAGEIARILGHEGRYADRPIRDAIRYLRRDGHLILSSVSAPYGYYMAANAEEWRTFRDGNLRPRALDILETTKAMAEAAQRMWGSGGPPMAQLELIMPT